MKKIAFRTMGGKEVGYGHLYRCLSLAKAVRKVSSESKIFFIINGNVKSIVNQNGFEYIESDHFRDDFKIIEDMCLDLVVFDSYAADDSYLRQVKKITMLMLFDDNNDIYDSRVPDILLNGNLFAKDLDYKLNPSVFFMLGPEYLVMKEEYWDDTVAENDEKEGILVTTGGSDTHNLSPAILKQVVNTDYTLKVIIGPGYTEKTINELTTLKNPHTSLILRPDGLKDYIRSSEYVITASGSTVYEALSQKTTPIIFCLADNQKRAYDYFKRYGVHAIGHYPDIRFDEIIHALNHPMDMNIKELHGMIDGRGALRVAQKIIRYLSALN